MTDLATDGSVQAGTPEAATGAVAGNEGSKPESATLDPFVGLDTENREWVGTKGLKDVAALASAARNAEKLIGKSIVLPGEDGKPEDWDKVWSRLGRPEKPDGYELAPPADMPDSMPYDADFAKLFKEQAFEARLPKSMAQSVHDWFVRTSVQKATENAQKAVDTANAALRSAWGDPASDTFKTNVILADRGIKALGGEDLMSSLQSVGLIGPKGEILNATIATAFAKAGKGLATEDTLTQGGQAIANNPYDPAKPNVTEQMRAWKSDPARARMMMRAAGKQPSDFGLPD